MKLPIKYIQYDLFLKGESTFVKKKKQFLLEYLGLMDPGFQKHGDITDNIDFCDRIRTTDCLQVLRKHTHKKKVCSWQIAIVKQVCYKTCNNNY